MNAKVEVDDRVEHHEMPDKYSGVVQRIKDGLVYVLRDDGVLWSVGAAYVRVRAQP